MKPSDDRIAEHRSYIYKEIGELVTKDLSLTDIENITALVRFSDNDDLMDNWVSFVITLNTYKSRLNDPYYNQ